MPRIANITDFRLAAKRRLPSMIFNYIDGGAYAETTLARNVDDLNAIALRQRVMKDVSTLNMGVELFGQKLPLPVILGPIGMAGLYARRGEVQAAQAAEKAGVPFTLSTVSICSLEEVRKAVTAPPWFQLYMIKDRGFMAALLERAKAAGCPVLMFTVDLPTPGSRYRDVRTGLAGALSLGERVAKALETASHPEWIWDVGVHGRPHGFGNIMGAVEGAKGPGDFQTWVGQNFDPSVTWADIEWVRARWDGPIVIKGVLDPGRRPPGRGPRGGRDRGVQPRRPPTRRRALRRRRPAPHRPGRGRPHHRAHGRGRALRPRRAEGPLARSQGRDAGPRVGLCAGRQARRRRLPHAAHPEERAARGDDAHRLYRRS